jgi:C4-dicarboxylate-specific signal transduction histidine kinase
MGSEAVIFVLLAVIVCIAILWHDDISAKRQAVANAVAKSKALKESNDDYEKACKQYEDRIVSLEAEIQRLRTIPLTQKPDKTENAVIKARSAADVRRLTEAAFGKQPEIGKEN